MGIRRPIRVVLEQDRLVLVPEKGSRENVQIFRHDGQLQGVIDPFVDAVRDRMQQWGIAGQGIYWRPILQARLGATSADAYRQLLRLLEDSGIEVTVQHGQTAK